MRQFLESLIKMDLSIIIVNFKTDKLVRDCINSINKSKPKVKYEIIVIDNSGDNRGFAKANNEGISKAKGKYVLLLNSDTIIKDGAIDKLYEFAKSKDNVGVVVPQLLNIDGSIQPSCFWLPTIGRAVRQYFLGEKNLGDKNLLDKYYPKEKEPIVVESAVMAAFLITPKALEKVGKLNEKYFLYFEDLDYCREVNKAGLKICYLPEAKVVHIHGASGGKNKLLIESAKKYHGFVGYYIYTFVLWLGQKWERIMK
jgi:GT2 family glycosyltransferase